MKWDVYATVAVQLEAETKEEAEKAAYDLPLEYWDETSMCVDEVVGRAD